MTNLERLEDGEVDSWSVSKLKAIGTCGKQFEFKYRQKLIKPVETPPLVFGSAVHKVIERLHKEGDKWEPRQWQEMWSDEWFEYSRKVEWGFYRKGQFDKLGLEMIARYITMHQDSSVIETEFGFGMGDQTQYFLEGFPIKGVIDQVRRLPNGKLMIVDLKTSKNKPDPLMLRADPQFTLYWHVAREKYGEEPEMAWLHLRTGELISTKRNENDLKIAVEMLKEAQVRVNAKMFARNIGYHCGFCVFMKDCLGELNTDAA